ncbi:rhamnosyl transferase, partial [Candidatus Pelagibacter sp.]|nr:rhamnosyl transferase [Candidatus Pelagibacter sp.]
MKAQNKTTKSNFWKKLFIKICRIFDFEIIDQSNLYLPVTNKKSTQNLSVVGKQSIILPMGKTKITRSIKSLDIILRTCSSVNMLSQSKKRVFASSKSE